MTTFVYVNCVIVSGPENPIKYEYVKQLIIVTLEFVNVNNQLSVSIFQKDPS